MLVPLAHPWAHSQVMLRIQGSGAGASKLSWSILQVALSPSAGLGGVKVKPLIMARKPGKEPQLLAVVGLSTQVGGPGDLGRRAPPAGHAAGFRHRLQAELARGEKGVGDSCLKSFNKHLSSRGGGLTEGTGWPSSDPRPVHEQLDGLKQVCASVSLSVNWG